MSRWIILRTSGAQTLRLAESLREAGQDAWSPARTLRRYMPAKTPTGQRLIETDAAILPTIVFVRALEGKVERDAQLLTLTIEATREPRQHPGFSIFSFMGRHGLKVVPFVADDQIRGLREEEAEQARLTQAMRDAESHAAAEAIRIAAIKSASAKRRAEQAAERKQRAAAAAAARQERTALRAKPVEIEVGKAVEVAGVPALVGVVGFMEGVEGHYANVRFGRLSWKIEGWQVMPSSHAHGALRSAAA